jgi:diguanylate cyclase (GGDEF)-like protein
MPPRERSAEESLRLERDEQAALNTILRISLEDIPLQAQFERVLEVLLALSWLPLEPRGGIFQVEGEEPVLVLKAQRNLAPALLTRCARVPFGHCLCGRAAGTREIQFAACVDGRHEIRYEGIKPHGHYNVPILSRRGLLGVIVLYLHEDHVREEREVQFLGSVASTLAGMIERKRMEEALRRSMEEMRASQDRLDHLAHHDALTGLPNRLLLLAHMEHALARARRDGRLLAVLFVDLDHFQVINDTLGHPLGDALLQEVARRLTACLREGDTVARLGGDEFTVVLEDLRDASQAREAAQRIIDAVSNKFLLEGHEVFVSCSVGIGVFPADGDDVTALLKNADSALYRAKEQGRNNCQYYTEELTARALARLELETSLRHALERHELVVHYQPQVDLHSGRIIGMEALVRWQHPRRGLVGPGEFIPLAEETGLIVPLGEWVLRAACARLKAWLDAGLPKLRVAVNLSSRQFNQKNLYETVAAVLRDTGLPPECLELELTESLVMQDPDGAIAVLTRLKALGVQFSIDDFGTGYSCLSYLKRFPIDRIKIDQSFVRNITTDPEDAAVSQAIISMSHSLHLKTVAEGVETPEQREFLRARQCDEVQGYHFSRPVPEAEMERLLREGGQLGGTRAAVEAEQHVLLLVDDEAHVLEALYRSLRKEGYRILRTTSPIEALRLLAAERIGVIVSDHRMPEMSGRELLDKVRVLHPQTVRIMLTGYADLQTLADALNESQVFKILFKPWSDEELRTDVRQAFRLHAQAGRQLSSG